MREGARGIIEKNGKILLGARAPGDLIWALKAMSKDSVEESLEIVGSWLTGSVSDSEKMWGERFLYPHFLMRARDAIDLRDAIEKRVSVRNYAEEPTSLEELSGLLWCTQGVKKVTNMPSTLRTVPSGGACHPFETYLLVNQVNGLSPGLYRFLAIEHKLVELNLDDDIADKITKACWGQPFIKKNAATFIWTFVPYRSIWFSGKRGGRSMIEAGHICQNLYLSAEAIRCGVCAIGAFSDEKMNSVLGIDTEEQFVNYMATVGKKK